MKKTIAFPLESSSSKIQAKMILKGTGSPPPPPTFPQLRSPLLRSPLSTTEGVKKGISRQVS